MRLTLFFIPVYKAHRESAHVAQVLASHVTITLTGIIKGGTNTLPQNISLETVLICFSHSISWIHYVLCQVTIYRAPEWETKAL